MTSTLPTDADALLKRVAAHARFAQREIDDWVLEVTAPQPGERVLDVGCGTGKQLLALAPRIGEAGELVGLDVSQAALTRARAALTAATRTPFALLESAMDDLEDTVPAGNPFDLALACFSLYYARDPAAVLRAVGKRLRPGGRFFVCGPARGNNAELLALVDAVVPRQEQPHRSDASLSFMEERGPRLFASTFTSVTFFDFENPVTFPTMQDLLEYWRAYHLYSPGHEAAFTQEVGPRFDENRSFTTCKRVRGALLS